MGSFDASIDLDLGSITVNIDASVEGVQRIIAGVMQREAVVGENWMKQNAPWHDRTGNARNGLAARYAREDDGGHSVTFFHQVPYGIFLETRHEGALAIILPAVQEFGARIMQDLTGALTRLPGGN